MKNLPGRGRVFLHIREETVEGVVEGLVVVGEALGGGSDWSESGGAGGDSLKGEFDSGYRSVGLEPVLSSHARKGALEVLTEPIRMTFHGVVKFGDKSAEIVIRECGPMLGEKVVEEDVDNDSGESPQFRGEKSPRFVEGGMVIRKAVEGSMHDDAGNDFFRVLLPQSVGSAAHEIAEEVSDAGGIGGTSEEDVGEVVQAALRYRAMNICGRVKPLRLGLGEWTREWTLINTKTLNILPSFNGLWPRSGVQACY